MSKIAFPSLLVVKPSQLRRGHRMYGYRVPGDQNWTLHTEPLTVTDKAPSSMGGLRVNGTMSYGPAFDCVDDDAEVLVERELCGGCGVALDALPARQINRGNCIDCLPR